MTKKQLIEQLEQYDDGERVWLHHKLKGEIMPAEIIVPINKIEYTTDGILLSLDGL